MPSNLENFTSQMKNFNVCELAWIKNCADRQIQQRRDADAHPPCRLLDLPAELRDRIYHFVILNHTKADRHSGATLFELPYILLSCKQIRSEFMKYGKRTLTCRMLLSIHKTDGSLEWRTVTNPSIIKGIAIAGGCHDSGVELSSRIVSRAEAVQALLLEWNEMFSDYPKSEYTEVIMEESWLGDTSGERCCIADLPKDFLARHL
ncbi:hypothetical protein AC578_3027 [Pseudocercospora eumusae]|uniref:F-box domain-containing protein n=1 Tax=Pseudocercospora eumusae TaxID=321146 RepID=A0A139H9R9_9PEZI|nr:hypothetical protein AC578_3027 [Pseudocercospora eumusae]